MSGTVGDYMEKTPILFLSDSISGQSGLARITRDLAMKTHMHCSDVFEVATVGYGGHGSRKFPFHEYHLHSVDNWITPELPAIWEDFVGNRDGILFAIWDMSRLYWLGNPQTCPVPFLRKWVETAKMQKWAYHAIDAEGPKGKWCSKVAETARGFNRLIDYSRFSTRITGGTEYLPHGIDTDVFKPYDKAASKGEFRKAGFHTLNSDALLVGVVATNQARKNWQLAVETCSILLDQGHDVKAWFHTDVLQRHWDLPALIMDYGLAGRCAITTTRFSDQQMAMTYSACDVTLGIGAEGFGYPIAESLACATPVVCGSYGGQSEFVPQHMQVDPVAFYYENPYCSKRPTHDAKIWAGRVLALRGEEAQFPAGLSWQAGILWPSWERWLRRGL
jgi:glycosyltransferase involved in cell wall biosynthesis